ncbi:MAG TPA: YIP1 family protein [Vicinamibacterales bacterium]|nr:YIP1 family protein [Vicinamibacterales bacterium]
MTDASMPSSPEPGLLGRAIGIITSPGAMFAHVVRDPRPATILFIVSAVIAVAATIPQFTETGRQAILNTQVEMIERFGQTVTDEMYAQMEASATSMMSRIFGIVGAFVWMPVVALFFTALFWGIFNVVFGGTATFKQVLGIVTHSMVIMAVGALAALPIQLMQTTYSMTGPFNFGALVPFMDPEGFVARFLSATNAFTIWQTIVLAIGLGVLYRRKSTGIAIGLLVAYAMLIAIGVALFSAFMGRMG